MYHFNQQERLFLLSLCCALIIGSVTRFAVKRYPRLNDVINVVEDRRFYPKININSADEKSLVRVPYIGEYTAKQIIAYRKQKGAFRSLNELKAVKGIRFKNFERFSPYLTVE